MAGNRLLIDPDTLWQITVGQWILDHRAVPDTDVFSFTMRGQPWISTQWLAQVLLAKTYAVRLERAGGAFGGRDRGHLRAVDELPQPASEREHDAGVRRRSAGADRAASLGAAACAGDAGDGGLGRRTDRCRGPAQRAVVLVAAADGAVGQSAWRLRVRPGADRADRARCRGGAAAAPRQSLLLRWAAFALAALVAGCCTPYGWDSLLAAQKILALGSRAAADHGMERRRFRQHRRRSKSACCSGSGWRCGAASGCRRAHPAAPGSVAHGAVAGARRRNPGAAGAAGARRAARPANRPRPAASPASAAPPRAACCSPASPRC